VPDYLATMTSLLAANPDAVLAYTDAWVLDDATGRVRKTTEMTYQRPPVPPPAAPREFLVELMKRNFIYNSVTVRRDALVEAGGYDERLRTSEDWELWLRLAALGRPCVRAPEALAVHRDHRGSLTTNPAGLRRSDQAVYRIIQEDWKTDDEIRGLARRLAAEGRGGRSRLDVSLARLVRPVRRRVQRWTLWHRRTPTEVARLLAAVSGR
jgi:GT2 family glycosyltransferase